MSIFDQCYQTRADFTNKPKNWKEFWYSELQIVQSIPNSIVLKKKSTMNFKIKNQLNLQYHSVNNYQLSIQLLTTSSIRGKLPTIVIFPDYVEKFPILKSILDLGFLVCLMQMRGHKKPIKTINEKGEMQDRKSYGYFANNIDNPNNYYMRDLLLDGYKTIEVLSEEPVVDSERIGVWGRGIGATMALFVSKFSNRISSQIIESPSFCGWENLHKSNEKYAKEIHSVLKKKSQSYQKRLQQNISYFDGIFFAENLETPSAFITNVADKKVSPEQSFALFHAIKGKKEIHVFTEDTPDSFKEQNKRTYAIVQKYFTQTL